jgi:hypothetical protein
VKGGKTSWDAPLALVKIAYRAISWAGGPGWHCTGLWPCHQGSATGPKVDHFKSAPTARFHANLVLIGQPPLLQTLSLTINEEIRSRVTYSTLLPRLGPEDTEKFIFTQFDRAGLGHNTFTDEALALVVRSSEGLLRRARNLCLSGPHRSRARPDSHRRSQTSQPCAHPTPLEEKL